MIHTNDHPPPHVHVLKDDMDARIYLDPVGVMTNADYNSREINKILKIVTENQVAFLARWDGIFPGSR